MAHTKNNIFTYFSLQYVVLFTMVPRNNNGGFVAADELQYTSAARKGRVVSQVGLGWARLTNVATGGTLRSIFFLTRPVALPL